MKVELYSAPAAHAVAPHELLSLAEWVINEEGHININDTEYIKEDDSHVYSYVLTTLSTVMTGVDTSAIMVVVSDYVGNTYTVFLDIGSWTYWIGNQPPLPLPKFKTNVEQMNEKANEDMICCPSCFAAVEEIDDCGLCEGRGRVLPSELAHLGKQALMTDQPATEEEKTSAYNVFCGIGQQRVDLIEIPQDYDFRCPQCGQHASDANFTDNHLS